MNFDYRIRFNAPCQPCTREAWQSLVRANEELLAEYHHTQDYVSFMRKAPVMMWLAHFPSGKGDDPNAQPSGLYILDVKMNFNDPKVIAIELVKAWGKDTLKTLGVKLVYLNEDGSWLRIIAAMLPHKDGDSSFDCHCNWLTKQLSLDTSQIGATDYAYKRPCYAPSLTDILYEADDLFEALPEVAEPAEAEPASAVPPLMPPLVQLFVEKSDPRFKAATVLAMLPILGGLATDLRMEFPDGEVHSPSFMAVIIAPQASGKSYARRIWRELTQRLHDEDEVAWEVERKWRELLKDSLRDAKKVDGMTKDPEVVIRLVPSKITEPQFFRRLHYSKGKHLIGFYEEIDSLTKDTKGSAYDDKRDLFREAFDNAEHGRDVANVESFSGMERIYYNFLALGTPNSVKRFYNNAEDGLVSRTIFYQLPIDVFSDLPRHEKITESERAVIRQWCDYLIDLKDRHPDLSDGDGHVLLPTDHLDRIWREWRDMAEERAVKGGSQAEGIFLKRASVIAWRACCIFDLLWGLKADEATLENLRNAFFWIADTVLEQQCAFFGDQLDSLDFTQKQRKFRSIYSDLPDEFTNEMVEAEKAKVRNKMPNATLIYRWKKAGLIVKLNSRTYKKLKQ